VSYVYGGPQDAAPTVTAQADALMVTGNVAPNSDVALAYMGAGLVYAGTRCADVSAFSGIAFDLRGDLGGCFVRFFVGFGQDVGVAADPARGACTSPPCYGPSVDLTATGSVSVPFGSLTNGVPIAVLDTRQVVDVQWQIRAPTSGVGCAASVAVAGVRFVK